MDNYDIFIIQSDWDSRYHPIIKMDNYWLIIQSDWDPVQGSYPWMAVGPWGPLLAAQHPWPDFSSSWWPVHHRDASPATILNTHWTPQKSGELNFCLGDGITKHAQIHTFSISYDFEIPVLFCLLSSQSSYTHPLVSLAIHIQSSNSVPDI